MPTTPHWVTLAPLVGGHFLNNSWVEDTFPEQLGTECDFAGDTVPVWRLFYAMENYIIHHRGQRVIYLRLSGVVPQGFYGW